MINAIEIFEPFVNKFGNIPTFHDSEIVELILKRKYKRKYCPTLLTRIYIKNYKTQAMYLLNISFKNIFGLKIENFNHQNVIDDLTISAISNEENAEYKNDERLLGLVSKSEFQKLKYKVKFEYCFGIETEFLCSEIYLDTFEKINQEDLLDL